MDDDFFSTSQPQDFIKLQCSFDGLRKKTLYHRNRVHALPNPECGRILPRGALRKSALSETIEEKFVCEVQHFLQDGKSCDGASRRSLIPAFANLKSSSVQSNPALRQAGPELFEHRPQKDLNFACSWSCVCPSFLQSMRRAVLELFGGNPLLRIIEISMK